jgi:predicted alpha/beta-fold hydrolase
MVSDDFVPLRAVRNAHLMTIAASVWPRRFPGLPKSVARLFESEPGTQLLGECHWQANPREHPTLVRAARAGRLERLGLHATARRRKLRLAGFNAVRLNQRNCGGTEQLTPTLYHSGLSSDIRAVIAELIERDGLPEIFAAGYSMGGNLVLKMAGEFGASAPRCAAGHRGSGSGAGSGVLRRCFGGAAEFYLRAALREEPEKPHALQSQPLSRAIPAAGVAELPANRDGAGLSMTW